MITQLQIEASRINGAKSRGPVTPEGKQTSARNATLHGLLAGSIVLKGESVARFEALHGSLLAEHQPVTQSEVALVDAMAAALWRQWRVWGFQKLSVHTDIVNHDGHAVTLRNHLQPPVLKGAKGTCRPQYPPRRRHSGHARARNLRWHL